MKSLLLNLGLFKLGWIACVFSAAAGMPVLGAVSVAAIAAIHVARSEAPRAEVALLGIAAMTGLIWETILVAGNILDYGNGGFETDLAPYWIVAMWVLFATTLNTGLRWLRRSPALAAIFGGVGGPISFLAGERIGAVTFAHPQMSLLVIGIGWALLLPLLVSIAERLETETFDAAQESA